MKKLLRPQGQATIIPLPTPPARYKFYRVHTSQKSHILFYNTEMAVGHGKKSGFTFFKSNKRTEVLYHPPL